MDLKRLKHLVALADTRHFGRAATQCHLTQSAFSRSIQAAEEEVGLRLFDRGTVEANCTDAGAFVVERARKLLFENRCLERDITLYRERLMGDLALGVGPFPAATLMPALLTAIRTRHPGVCVRVEVNNADNLAAHLRAEQLDFYMAEARNVAADADLSVTALPSCPPDSMCGLATLCWPGPRAKSGPPRCCLSASPACGCPRWCWIGSVF